MKKQSLMIGGLFLSALLIFDFSTPSWALSGGAPAASTGSPLPVPSKASNSVVQTTTKCPDVPLTADPNGPCYSDLVNDPKSTEAQSDINLAAGTQTGVNNTSHVENPELSGNTNPGGRGGGLSTPSSESPSESKSPAGTN